MKDLNQKISDAADIISKAGRKGNGSYVFVTPENGVEIQKAIEEIHHRQKIKERRLKIEKLKNGIKR